MFYKAYHRWAWLNSVSYQYVAHNKTELINNENDPKLCDDVKNREQLDLDNIKELSELLSETVNDFNEIPK